MRKILFLCFILLMISTVYGSDLPPEFVEINELLPPNKYAESVIYSDDGEFSATTSEEGISVWSGEPFVDLFGYLPKTALRIPVTDLIPITFDHDATQLVVRTYNINEDKEQLYLIDIHSNGVLSEKTSWNVSQREQPDALYSADDEYLILFLRMGTPVGILDKETHHSFKQFFNTAPLIEIQASPTEQIFAIFDESHRLTVYTLPYMYTRYSESLSMIPAGVDDVQLRFSPDGRYLSLLYSNECMTWDTESYEKVIGCTE